MPRVCSWCYACGAAFLVECGVCYLINVVDASLYGWGGAEDPDARAAGGHAGPACPGPKDKRTRKERKHKKGVEDEQAMGDKQRSSGAKRKHGYN